MPILSIELCLVQNLVMAFWNKICLTIFFMTVRYNTISVSPKYPNVRYA